MYRRILVALENGPADRTLLPHVTDLARLAGSELVLVHVADGWVARNYERLKLAESEEMKDDRRYLEATAAELREGGFTVAIRLALGDPPTEILKAAKEAACDLIAMGSHGHRIIGDIIHGSTITQVRHRTDVPVLLVREKKG